MPDDSASLLKTDRPLLNEVESHCIALFSDGAKLLGLPKSMGEIYGLMYVTNGPLTLNDLVTRLGISKGSASQGLKALRQLGAVIEDEGENGSRRVHFRAAVELKSLIGGFIRSEVRPHLAAAEQQVIDLERLAIDAGGEQMDFYCERAERLKRWSSRASFVLPLIQRVMGG